MLPLKHSPWRVYKQLFYNLSYLLSQFSFKEIFLPFVGNSTICATSPHLRFVSNISPVTEDTPSVCSHSPATPVTPQCFCCAWSLSTSLTHLLKGHCPCESYTSSTQHPCNLASICFFVLQKHKGFCFLHPSTHPSII